MDRPTHSRARRSRAGSALVMAGLLLAGCTAETGTGDAEPAPATATEPSRPSAEPSVDPSAEPSTELSAEPDPGPAEQAVLDERLRDAAWANDVDRAADLIARGADVNAKDETQQSAYLISTSEGYLLLLRLTLAHGADVTDRDSWNGTGLIRAAERGHYLVVGELLQAGIERNHVNRIGYQAIHEAVWLGADNPDYVDTVRVLVAGGVRLDRPSGNEGLTPLEMARSRGFDRLQAVLKSALESGPVADPDAALLRAARTGDADLAARALRAGADLGVHDPRGRTPLAVATVRDHAEVARLLVALGAGRAG